MLFCIPPILPTSFPGSRQPHRASGNTGCIFFPNSPIAFSSKDKGRKSYLLTVSKSLALWLVDLLLRTMQIEWLQITNKRPYKRGSNLIAGETLCLLSVFTLRHVKMLWMRVVLPHGGESCDIWLRRVASSFRKGSREFIVGRETRLSRHK